MFGYYPRPQPTYSPFSTYAAQQQRARAYELERRRQLELQQQQQELERRRALAQRARASRYFPDGYDEPDDDDEYPFYLSPHQRAAIQARRRQAAFEQAMRQGRPEPMRASASPARAPSPPTKPTTPKPTQIPSSPKQPAQEAEQPATPSPSNEQLEAAAITIQTAYRVHRSLRTIARLADDFASLKAGFVQPTTIDYQSPAGVVSVSVPSSIPSTTTTEELTPTPAKLAYTPTNVPLHTYIELLSRLLVSLDGVESYGDKRVRDARRAVVRAVESEAGRVEAFWRDVWAAHVLGEQAQQQQQEAEEAKVEVEESEEDEVSAMVVDAPTPLPTTPELELEPAEEDVVADEDEELEFTTPESSPAPQPVVLANETEEDGFELVQPEKEEELDEKFVVVQ
uniref:BAG domain-containing protein n=1 Tax=Mycena chlorophos TaxID=658473 RepID=A0ABQ0LJB9_MYCCL|nr:predicted protein [Mycena chlorophos]